MEWYLNGYLESSPGLQNLCFLLVYLKLFGPVHARTQALIRNLIGFGPNV